MRSHLSFYYHRVQMESSFKLGWHSRTAASIFLAAAVCDRSPRCGDNRCYSPRRGDSYGRITECRIFGRIRMPRRQEICSTRTNYERIEWVWGLSRCHLERGEKREELPSESVKGANSTSATHCNGENTCTHVELGVRSNTEHKEVEVRRSIVFRRDNSPCRPGGSLRPLRRPSRRHLAQPGLA